MEGGNIRDTRGPRGPTALRPLTVANTIALLCQSANGRQVSVGDRQNNDLICIICILISIQKDNVAISNVYK